MVDISGITSVYMPALPSSESRTHKTRRQIHECRRRIVNISLDCMNGHPIHGGHQYCDVRLDSDQSESHTRLDSTSTSESVGVKVESKQWRIVQQIEVVLTNSEENGRMDRILYLG